MSDSFTPETAEDARDIVRWAAAEHEPLEIVGRGSKRALGRPVQAGHRLHLSRLAGVEMYEPAELVLTVLAGTPIAEVERLVADNGQELAFDPMDYGPLLGGPAGDGTIGGVIAANLSGSKRLKHGAARDHILGLEAISGRGELFKSGGRVVKNVTGYDLPRALCGSWGTLAVATRITLKVLPRAETEASVLLRGLDGAAATTAMTTALGSSAEVSAAAHLPAGVVERCGEDAAGLTGAATLLRLEGFGLSVDYRFETLRRLLAEHGAVERIEADASRRLWSAIRDVKPFTKSNDMVWRVSLAPTAGAGFAEDLAGQMACSSYLDWSGGLVWLAVQGTDPQAQEVRAAVARAGGGHATLMRAPEPVRAVSDVFQPQPGPLAALAARLKEQFDPHGVLNPGRMVAGG